MTLHGRADELATLRVWLAGIGAGRPGSLLVHGPAGVGKTSLVREAVASRSEIDVIWVSGDEAEQLLPFGMVDQVWAQHGRSRPTADGDALVAGADLVGLLGGHEAPVVLVVDDAQWVDAASVRALRFALRRLDTDDVSVLMVCRDPGSAEPLGGVIRSLRIAPNRMLELPGLGAAAVASLAAEHGVQLSNHAARDLAEQSRGNPLHVLEMLPLLRAEGSMPEGSGLPLPSPPSVAELVATRLATLPAPTRSMVELASVLGVKVKLEVLAALAGNGEPGLFSTLDPAVTSGVVQVVDGSVRFGHPLHQSATYHLIPPSARADLHRRAAAASAGAEQMRHLIAAAEGVDPDLAQRVATQAATLAQSGDHATAAGLFRAAERLAGPGPLRSECLLNGVEATLLSGGELSQDRAVALAALPPSAHRGLALGTHLMFAGERLAAVAEWRAGWTLLKDGEDLLAARLAAGLARQLMNDCEPSSALQYLDGAMRTGEGPLSGLLRCQQAMALGQAGRLGEGLAVAMAAASSTARAEAAVGTLAHGILLLWSERADEAIGHLSVVEQLSEFGAPLYLRIMALVYRADAHLRCGEWDAALTDAQLASSLAASGGDTALGAVAESYVVMVLAARGDTEQTNQRLARCRSFATRSGDVRSRGWATMATVSAAHARGDRQQIVAAFEPWWSRPDTVGSREPGIVRWADLYAEALVDSGRYDEARAVLDEALRIAVQRGNQRACAAYHRVGADLLAATVDLADADAVQAVGRAYDQVIAAVGDRRDLEAALARMAQGRWLLRIGDTPAARAALTRAEELLAGLGAEPYLRRCRDDLARAGGVPLAPNALRQQLTAQELAVCTLLATGMANKQIARHLVVSSKTVEFHLSNAYRKAGVSSRAALVAKLASPEST